MSFLKESPIVRYAYGVAGALLLGGTVFSIATGPVGAQVAQNNPSAMAAPRPGAPMSFADLAARLAPAVVNISTKQRVAVKQQADPFEQFFRQFGGQVPGQDPSTGNGNGSSGGQPATREAGSLGSGFIISPDGYIVTNNHLIQSETGTGTVDSVTVKMTNRREYQARIVGRDQASDLALLKIDGQNLPFVNWGDSTRARVGDWIIAIGNPYGLDGTVTAGIISALHRGITGAGAYDRYIQTDASINMGNSGGPMFDLNGNVIGINSALISPTGASVGIGLAIPAELAQPVIETLRKGQRPSRGYLGVSLQPLDENIAASLGLPKDMGELVRSVQPGDPGARAGLQQGDVILGVAGQQVTPDQTVSYLIANTQVGSKVPLDIVRGSARQRVVVTVGQRPTEDALNKAIGNGTDDITNDGSGAPTGPAVKALGLSLQPLSTQLAQAIGVPPGTHGVVIVSVDPSSDASDKGLRPRDVIVSVNRMLVSTPAQVSAVVGQARASGRTSVLLLVKRGTQPELFVGINILPTR